MDPSNCISGDINNVTMIIWGLYQLIYGFNDFPLFSNIFVSIHEYTNYANEIISME